MFQALEKDKYLAVGYFQRAAIRLRRASDVKAALADAEKALEVN